VATYVHCVKKTSRSVANIILALFEFFLDTTAAFAGLNPSAGPYSLQYLPRNISTCIKYLDIDPVLNQTISCPQYFTQYPLDTLVTYCQQRPSPRSSFGAEDVGRSSSDGNRPSILETSASDGGRGKGDVDFSRFINDRMRRTKRGCTEKLSLVIHQVLNQRHAYAIPSLSSW